MSSRVSGFFVFLGLDFLLVDSPSEGALSRSGRGDRSYSHHNRVYSQSCMDSVFIGLITYFSENNYTHAAIIHIDEFY